MCCEGFSGSVVLLGLDRGLRLGRWEGKRSWSQGEGHGPSGFAVSRWVGHVCLSWLRSRDVPWPESRGCGSPAPADLLGKAWGRTRPSTLPAVWPPQAG